MSFIFKPKTPQVCIESLQETLKVWGLLGGLGGRARRGFGAISLLSLKYNENESEKFDDELSEYSGAVEKLLKRYDDITTFPPYSAFSQQTRFKVISPPTQDVRKAHNLAGEVYKNFRGQESDLWGNQKIPFGLPLAKADEKNRRSSPLFFHVHPLKNNQFVSCVLYLPAVFHYERDYSTQNLTQFYQQVSTFMDSL
ncbi:hypothetical protein BGP_2301 [Beggiatoa sp. PS]|nr:hypothetical protein BGP_2301 [Beggiatoa sp. PS]